MAWINTELLKYFADEFAAKITALFVKKEDGKGLSSNDYTDAEKNKLEGLSNLTQADWNETDPTSDAFIKNKPVIPTATEATPADIDTIIAGTFS